MVVVDLASASTAPAAIQRILSAVHHEAGERWRDGVARLLAPLRPGSFTLTASTDATGSTLAMVRSPGVRIEPASTCCARYQMRR